LSNFSNLSDLSDFRDFRDLSNLSDFRDFRDLSDLRYLRYLRDGLLKEKTLEIAQQALPDAESRQKIDLLTIFEARMLQFQLEANSGAEVEQETQWLAEAALKESEDKDPETREAVLEVLRSLPARTIVEIHLIQQIAQKAQNAQIQAACATALKYALPLDEQAWQAIEQVQTSSLQELAEAAKRVIDRKQAQLRKDSQHAQHSSSL
jgi:hypothetical protein